MGRAAYTLELSGGEASHLFDWIDSMLARDAFTDDENREAAEAIRAKLASF